MGNTAEEKKNSTQLALAAKPASCRFRIPAGITGCVLFL